MGEFLISGGVLIFLSQHATQNIFGRKPPFLIDRQVNDDKWKLSTYRDRVSVIGVGVSESDEECCHWCWSALKC